MVPTPLQLVRKSVTICSTSSYLAEAQNIDVFLKDYAIIMGHVATCEEMRERYRVDEVKTFPFSSDMFYLCVSSVS
jgi:hypothetical protein